MKHSSTRVNIHPLCVQYLPFENYEGILKEKLAQMEFFAKNRTYGLVYHYDKDTSDFGNRYLVFLDDFYRISVRLYTVEEFMNRFDVTTLPAERFFKYKIHKDYCYFVDPESNDKEGDILLFLAAFGFREIAKNIKDYCYTFNKNDGTVVTESLLEHNRDKIPFPQVVLILPDNAPPYEPIFACLSIYEFNCFFEIL